MIRIIIFLWQHYTVAGVLSFHCLAISIDVQYVGNNVFLLRFIHWLWILWRENIASNYAWPFISCIIYSYAHSLFCGESDCVSLWWSRFDDLFVAYSWGLRLQSVMSCWLTRCCSMHWKAFVWIECNILVIRGPRTILVSCRLNYCLQMRTNWKKKKKKKTFSFGPCHAKSQKDLPLKKWRTVCECTFLSDAILAA